MSDFDPSGLSVKEEALIRQTILVMETNSRVANLVIKLLDQGNVLESSILLREQVEANDKNAAELRDLIFKFRGRDPKE